MDDLFNVELERAFLGCVLIDQNTWTEAAIRPADFYIQKNMFIATAIDRLLKSGSSADVVTVSHELNKYNQLAEIGGDAYLTSLVTSAPTSLNAITYAEQIKDLRSRRQLVDEASRIAKLAYDTQKQMSTVAAEARQGLDNALNSSKSHSGRSIGEALKEFDETIESRKDKPFSLLGFSTGYQDIDYTLDGLQNGWLYLVAARPGMGKTAMLGNLAINVAKQQKKVLFFSAEMHDQRIVARMIAAETKINSDILKHARMKDEEEWRRYFAAIETFEHLPLRLYKPDECRMVEQIENITRQLYANGEVEIIFVDYLQLLQVDAGVRTSTREQEVTKIAQTLKRITNLNIPVVAAAQLSRAIELRSEGKPQLSDLRESGSLEQEADAVCFLYHPDDDPDKSLEFIVAKNRDGALGECSLHYDKTTQKINSGLKKTIALNP